MAGSRFSDGSGWSLAMKNQLSSCQTHSMYELSRLAQSQLYLVCDGRPGTHELRPFLNAALSGGVDIIQLRDKNLDDRETLAAAEVFRQAAEEFGALFILNDRPDLAAECGAHGVHLGQDDQAVEDARSFLGPEYIIGRSTHAPEQAADALADHDVNYLSIGPVYETPTKPGRPPTGLEYVNYASSEVGVVKPWFAIGGIDEQTLPAVLARGALRVVVVRAITLATDPEAAARRIKSQLLAELERRTQEVRG
jgi:thiamine-phosphate pyrophosphorylase